MERWCLMARPFSMSAFALERVAATVVCSSAIILRTAARSYVSGFLGEESLMLVSLSSAEESSPSSSSV